MSIKEPRKVFKKWFTYLLFACIIFVFVAWGFDRQGSNDIGSGVVAQVNDEIIPLSEFRQVYQNQIQFYKSLMGDKFDESMLEKMGMNFRGEVARQLISRYVLAQGLKKEGFIVSDEEVSHSIYSIPYFQKDKRFQREIYNNFLQYQRTSANQFENSIRKDLTLTRFQKLLESVLSPSDLAFENSKKAESVKFAAEYVSLEPQVFNPNTKEVDNFLSEASNQVKVQNNYDQNKEKYKTEEQVHARHILVKIDSQKPESEKAALEKIKSLKEQSEKEGFEKVARESSEDIGSKQKGGDLGYFGRETMVKEFADAAFQLPLNKISEPIKSPFGYHLIQVLDKRPEGTIPLDETLKRAIAKEILAQEKSSRTLKQVEETLKNTSLSYQEKSKNLQALLRPLGLSWKKTESFSLSSTQVAPFGPSDDVLKLLITTTATKPLVDQVLRVGEKSFLIKRAQAAEKKKVDKDAKGQDVAALRDTKALARLFSGQMLRDWEKVLQQNSKIVQNPRVLSQ